MALFYSDNNPERKDEEDWVALDDGNFSLIVWNDEVNTFDWVIKALVEICGQTEEQAEQCALIIHLKGKYAVKNGSYEDLKPKCDGLTDRGINATIESMVH